MRKSIKGYIGPLAAALMILTSVVTLANPVIYTNKSATLSISENNAPYNDITPIPNPSDRPILWNNGLPNGEDALSCVLQAGNLDREVIDDFIVDAGGWYVSDAHCRIILDLDLEPSSLIGFKVYFYANGETDCNPMIGLFAERNATFNAYHTGDLFYGRREIAVDLDFDEVFLQPGRWWICIQPAVNDNCFWLTSEQKECPVYISYPDREFYKWTAGNIVFGEDFDVSFQITGEKKSKTLPTYQHFFEILKIQFLLLKFIQQIL